MAKIYGLGITRLSGSVGKMTLRSTTNGNIVSEKVSQVTNPRTTGQQRQRMYMSSVMAGYRALKTICNHSFEGCSTPAANMARFMKLNLSMIAAEKNGCIFKGSKYMPPAKFVVSEGSLSLNVPKAAMIYALASSTKTNTVRVLHDLFNLEVGDELAVVNIYKGEFGARFENQWQPSFHVALSWFVWDKTKADLPAFVKSEASGNYELNKEALILDRSFNYSDIIASQTLGFSTPSLENKEKAWSYFIASRKSGSTWLRSSLQLDGILLEDYETQFKADTAIRSYNPSGLKPLNNAVLN